MKYWNKDLKSLAEEQHPNRSPFLFTSKHSKELNRRAAAAQNTSPRVAATSRAYPTQTTATQEPKATKLQVLLGMQQCADHLPS